MVELIVECWSYPDGGTEYFWSLWQDGKRVQFSDRRGSGESAEAEGRDFCRRTLGTAPDKVTHL